ncbi:TetR/AcrR family transcriptional regulator [Planobispora longispora]|uniref:TetR/AcrR family transcriptional regulator n=1 Tax=Planobispora longispora TaxID=28887 RepID=UPI001EF67B9B|nr:TetR/AcrR family transcriptional regulator [Planobispora longispora]
MGSSVRRNPVQQRSVERVNQMLDAAAALLDEGGYEALSTRAVAARAEVPIGSIYHFFRDKRGLADALARRNLERFLAGVERRLAGVTHWTAMVDLIVDEYVEMKRTVPGFAVVDFRENKVVAESLAAHLARRIAPADAADLIRPMTVAVEAADALLKLAFRESPGGDPHYVAETKELLRAYLDRALPH